MQLLYFFLSGRCPHNFGLCAQHHHHDRTWLGLPRMHLCGGLRCFAGRRVTVPKRYFLSWRQYHHHHHHHHHHTSYIIHHTSYIIHHTSYIIHHTSYIIIHHTSVHIILIILIIIILLLLIIIVIAIITVIILIFLHQYT